jgi:hypothetical protein
MPRQRRPLTPGPPRALTTTTLGSRTLYHKVNGIKGMVKKPEITDYKDIKRNSGAAHEIPPGKHNTLRVHCQHTRVPADTEEFA